MRMAMWLDDLFNDLRLTARNLVKNPVFTLIVILTVALGIGANTTIFTLLDAVVFKPLPVRAPTELVTLYEKGPEGPADIAGGTGQYMRFSFPRFERLERALGAKGSLAAVTRSSRFAVRLPGAGERHFVQAQLVSSRYFATLGVQAARGRLLTPEDVRRDRIAPVAVISDGFWKRSLGANDAAIGQTLDVNGVSVTIIGIAPPAFVGMWTDSEADLWLPLTLQQSLHYQNNSSSYGKVDRGSPWLTQDLIAWLNIVGRIAHADRPGVVPVLQTANRHGLAELASFLPDVKTQRTMAARTLSVEPFSRGFSVLRGRFSDALFALAGMVALVLLITCANIANLLLARAAGHARDLGIRISLGASTGRLIRQSLTESFVLAFLGAAFGLLFGGWASRFLALQVLDTSQQLPVVFTLDERVLAFAIVLSLVSAAAFGSGSALRAVRVARSASLGTNQRQVVGHVTTRGMRSLVVGQLALSLVLVVAAILLSRTFINFMRIDPGF
jgi:predicted permease